MSSNQPSAVPVGSRKLVRPRTPDDRRIVAGIDVDQLAGLPVEHDEHRRGKPVARRVPAQMPVDLRRQRRHVRRHARQAAHQRLDVGRQQRRRDPLAGHVRDREQRAVAGQIDDVEVVAANRAQRLVERVDLVARERADRGRLQGLLNLLRGKLLRFELRLADQFRRQRRVLQAEAEVVDQQDDRKEDQPLTAT